MTMAINMGVLLPTIGQFGNEMGDIREVAKLAENVGLDSVWTGDHLNMGGPVPVLEATTALTMAAAVTRRVHVGYSVMLAAMRTPVWTVKQLGTLQYLSGNRVQFGVGVGALWESEWQASGVSVKEIGRRTDNLLKVIPGLLSGEPTRMLGVPDEPEVTLLPAVPVPPIWMGGWGEKSLHRTAEYCDGWLTTVMAPDDMRVKAKRLKEIAEEHDRPAPQVGTMIYGTLVRRSTPDTNERMARHLADTYPLDIDYTRKGVVGGTPQETAHGLARYVEAGAEQFVFAVEGTTWREQFELLAEVRETLIS